MITPADQQARNQAQDIQRSFIVQAPAGSGKTELLTMRMLRLLAAVEQPEEILCITFTNKAAAEMKERILSSISPAFTDQVHPEAHKNEKAQLGKQVYQRSQEKGWNLLLNPGRLAVRTIDSFNHFLIRQMPVLSGMGSTVSISEEPQELYQQAVRNLLELADSDTQQSLKHLLQHLDNRYQRVEQRLIEMLAIRDQWLPMVLHDAPDEMLIHIENNLQDLIEAELKSVRRSLTASVSAEFTESAAQAAQHLLEADSNSIITQLEGLGSIPDASINSLNQWKAIAELVLTKTDTVRKSITKNQGFPAGKKHAEHKQQFLACLSDIANNETLIEQLSVIKKLPVPNYSEEQAALLNSLFILLKTLYASLKIVFDEQQNCDHSEISLAALRSLGTEQQPTDLALSLDYRFQHILIDEFQDTSNLQIQLLEKLTLGWQPDDGRSLFLVGDPMQSIYKFRQADVGIYLSTQQNGVGNIALESLRLTANFRSQAGIINWINTQFSQIFGDTNSWLHGEIAYSASTASRPALPAPCVAVESFLFVDAPDHTAQADKTVELIHQSQQQEPEGKIAILVRARTHLLTIVEQLKRANIPFQAVDIDPLAGLPYIGDLQTLTRALCHPADRIAWLALLRSPACGLTLKSLLTISDSGSADKNTTIWQQLHAAELIQQLNADDQLRIERLIHPLKRCLDQIGRKPFRVLLEGCWIELGGMLFTESSTALDNTRGYFSLIENLCSDGQLPDIPILEKRLQRLYAQPQTSSANAVQIMTIHKAKGLEFETVILPSLERPPRGNEDKLLNWHIYRNDQNNNELLLAPIQSSFENSQDSIQEYLKYIDQKRSTNELKRLLYVAITRAKNRLFLLGNIKSDADSDTDDTAKEEQPEIDKPLNECYKSPIKNSLLKFLWPDILEQAEIDETDITESDFDAAQPTALDQPLLQLPAGWQSDFEFIDQHSFTKEQNTASQASNELPADEGEINSTAAAIGTLVHRTLAQITEDGIESWNPQRIEKQRQVWQNQLQQQGVYLGLEQAVATIAKQISRCCTGEHGAWLLDNRHTDSQVEWPFSIKTATGYKQYRVDRTFIDQQGIRWIIDYKSSQPAIDPQNPANTESLDHFLQQQAVQYQQQMQTYSDGFLQLEDRPIKLALYYPAIDYFQVL
ncbi:MAG: UvrD-helicase domain-containing protein [Pseudomonadales bacterium]|nr:UvrD-helicase domain-containing protein [Pseudomonadales bacterium]